jgi:hypothetical protein
VGKAIENWEDGDVKPPLVSTKTKQKSRQDAGATKTIRRDERDGKQGEMAA